MQELITAARKAFQEKQVGYIIGYAKAPGKELRRPFIAHNEDEANQLVFDNLCVNNLAVYLTRLDKPKVGKIGIVLKGCDIRAAIALMQEQQIKRDDIYIFGMQCGGVVEDVDAAFSKDNTAVKCLMCQVQTPQLYDVIIGTTQSYEKPSDHTGARLEQLTALNAADKFAFWEDEFDKCIKCYACRQVCPLCYCEQCIVDKTTPRWIESSASLRGNFTWNAIRAFHLAGRCVGCGECERACPMDIPLMLLNRKMGMIAMKEFNYRHGTNPEEPTLVGSYNISDHEDFIK